MTTPEAVEIAISALTREMGADCDPRRLEAITAALAELREHSVR